MINFVVSCYLRSYPELRTAIPAREVYRLDECTFGAKCQLMYKNGVNELLFIAAMA